MSNAPSLVRPTPPGFKAILLGQLLPRRTPTSQVRLRAELVVDDERLQACTLVDALGDDALTLSVNMLALDQALQEMPYDASARAAARSLRTRLTEMEDVADAFFDVLVICSTPLAARLLANGAPLGDYLRGVVAWWAGTLKALERLAAELRTLSVDWAAVRSRIEDASAFLLPDLVADIRTELAFGKDAPEHAALDMRLEVLFANAEWLATGLRQRFG
jgi:hypothetical protein